MSDPDYELRFGANWHLKGRGWRGLLALLMVLLAIGFAVDSVPSFTSKAWQILQTFFLQVFSK